MEKKYKNRGYLKEKFKIFHLSDIPEMEVPLHYHDFIKILILIKGNISYIIEERQYELRPYDIVLVDAGEIHRPVINDKSEYERIIIYISREFFDNFTKESLISFLRSDGKGDFHVIRGNEGRKNILRNISEKISDEACRESLNGELLQKCRLTEFLILLLDSLHNNEAEYANAVSQNHLIMEIIKYINENIKKQLSIDDIADAVHMNRSYIMHRFKAETGCTIKEYITEKRLASAKKYIEDGASAKEACFMSGFNNYTGFYRAFKKKYSFSPKEYNEADLMNSDGFAE